MDKQAILEIIAKNLRNLLNEKELSSSVLARRCNMSTGTISKIINGNMSITIPLAMNLADGLGVDISDLLNGLTREKVISKSSSNKPKEHMSIAVISIDSKRVTCIKDHNGKIIGQSELDAGMDLAETNSNLYQFIQEAIYSSIKNTAENRKNLKNAKLNLVMQSYEFEETKNKFLTFVERYFHSVQILSDWQLCFLTAFNKTNPGISLIIDKGVSLSYIKDNKIQKLGGWKFPVYDLGGQNWLGIQAIRHAIEVFEGYTMPTKLSKVILSKFNNKIKKITETAIHGVKNNNINEIFYNILIQQYLKGEPTAKKFINNGLIHIKKLLERCDQITGKKYPITINGSLAFIYEPLLDSKRIIETLDNYEKASILAGIEKKEFENYGIINELP